MQRPVQRVTAVAALLLVLAAGCAGSGRHPAGAGAQAGTQAPPTSPSAAGATATPGAGSAAPSATVGTQAAGWPTYQGDVARTGRDSTSPVAGSVSRRWSSAPLDGDLYGQPLVAGGRVVVATGNDTVYALDPATGRVQWSTHLGGPVSGSSLPCGNIDPSGITGTPAVDTNTGVIWVVAFVQPGRHDLVALELPTGHIKSRRSVDPPGADPLVEQQRGALALANGHVYVAFGGLFGDCGDYHGYVVGAPAGGGALEVWRAPTSREGGVWAPPGPVVDASGHLFVTTGNAASSSTFDEGNAVIRLSPTLVQEDLFAPSNWAQLNQDDADLGSVSPSLLPGGLVVQVGKEGVAYVLDAAHLGGVGGQRAKGRVCGSAFGGTAVSGSTVFIPCRDGLSAVTVSGSGVTVNWRGPSSAAGTPTLAGGLVWLLGPDGRLLGLDQGTGNVRFSDHLSGAGHFPAVTAVGGQLFVPAGALIVAYQGI